MKSKVNIKSHPVHPMLVSFPITLFTGAFVADIILLLSNNAIFFTIAVYLEAIGILAALIAAIPGIIDYFLIIPPKSSAKKRGTKHGLVNILTVLVFSLALYLRMATDTPPVNILLTETAGIILMITAAWWGGTLIYRNQIGVDHRYAHAGKWGEQTLKTDQKLIELHGLDSLKVNQMKLLHINGKRIVVANTDKGFAAFEDFCNHHGGPLSDGALICGTVQCPWHGSQFDVHTGELKAGPATQNIKTYPIVKEYEKVYLQL